MEKRIEVSLGFVSLLCLLGWYDWNVCLWFILSLFCHELGHGIAMVACKVPFYGVALKTSGAVIKSGFCGYRQELICALAGPVASFLLALLAGRFFSDLALVSICLGTVNVLPLYPLDGGRILRAALMWKLEETRVLEILSRVTFAVCCLLMAAACWVTTELQMGIWPIFAVLAILCRVGNARWSEQ